jgi:hypothetical protein
MFSLYILSAISSQQVQNLLLFTASRPSSQSKLPSLMYQPEWDFKNILAWSLSFPSSPFSLPPLLSPPPFPFPSLFLLSAVLGPLTCWANTQPLRHIPSPPSVISNFTWYKIQDLMWSDFAPKLPISLPAALPSSPATVAVCLAPPLSGTLPPDSLPSFTSLLKCHPAWKSFPTYVE